MLPPRPGPDAVGKGTHAQAGLRALSSAGILALDPRRGDVNLTSRSDWAPSWLDVVQARLMSESNPARRVATDGLAAMVGERRGRRRRAVGGDAEGAGRVGRVAVGGKSGRDAATGVSPRGRPPALAVRRTLPRQSCQPSTGATARRTARIHREEHRTAPTATARLAAARRAATTARARHSAGSRRGRTRSQPRSQRPMRAASAGIAHSRRIRRAFERARHHRVRRAFPKVPRRPRSSRQARRHRRPSTAPELTREDARRARRVPAGREPRAPSAGTARGSTEGRMPAALADRRHRGT